MRVALETNENRSESSVLIVLHNCNEDLSGVRFKAPISEIRDTQWLFYVPSIKYNTIVNWQIYRRTNMHTIGYHCLLYRIFT